MSNRFITLLGKDHDDPEKYAIESIDDSLAIGISSVVTKESKSHNWANNEDAAGLWEDDDVLIGMVADAHWGYVASQEAVLRFPKVFLRNRDRLNENVSRSSGVFRKLFRPKTEELSQAYLEAILDLCEQELPKIGERSKISYGKTPYGEELWDNSHSQFYSVVRAEGKHYFVGLGDCACAIIGQDSVTMVKSKNISYGAVGSALSPRVKMVTSPYEPCLQKDACLHFDDLVVRKGVDVQQLNVSKGDVIFMCTDGFPIYSEKVNLPKRFYDKTVEQGVSEIMQDVMEHKDDYSDNIAICAIRVK